MTLLNPAGLFLLLSIPLIVMLHLFRQERRRQEVSSLFLWKEISDQRSRRIRPQLLRNINLLLQVIAAALIALAVARPVLASSPADGARRLILLVDTSAGMAATDGQLSRLDLARNRAREIVGRSRRDAEVMVASVGPLPLIRQGFTTDRSVVYEAIRDLRVQDGAGELRSAVAMIRSLGDASNTDVVFVTDGAFDLPDSVELPRRFRIESVGTPLPNLAITAFELRRRFDASVMEAYLEIANFDDTERSVFLELLADDTSLSRRQYQLPAGETERIAAELPGTSARVYEARLLDTDDALATDDVAFAVAGGTRPLHIQLVTPGNYFLESILSVYPNVRLTVTEAPSSGVRTDVFVLDSVEIPAGLTGSVLAVNTVFPGGPFEPSGYVEPSQVIAVNRSHPISRNLDLSDIAVSRIIVGEISERALVVAASGTAPVVYTFNAAGLRLAGILFSLAESDLGLRSSFPVLMNNVITWLAPSPGESGISSASAGTVMPILVNPGSPFVITTPSGSRNEFITRENTFNFADTMDAGLYEVTGEDFTDVFAVSLTDSAESDLRPRTAAAVESAPVTAAGTSDTGAPLAYWLLVLAVALFAADWVIWARRT